MNGALTQETSKRRFAPSAWHLASPLPAALWPETTPASGHVFAAEHPRSQPPQRNALRVSSRGQQAAHSPHTHSTRLCIASARTANSRAASANAQTTQLRPAPNTHQRMPRTNARSSPQRLRLQARASPLATSHSTRLCIGSQGVKLIRLASQISALSFSPNASPPRQTPQAAAG